jgi:hypothetical protein
MGGSAVAYLMKRGLDMRIEQNEGLALFYTAI